LTSRRTSWRPTEASPGRRICGGPSSTTYYALFHAAARCCADAFIGANGGASPRAWSAVYRSLEHGFMRSQCLDQERMKAFPLEIQNFANALVTMQAKRHRADYDPAARFQKSAVALDVAQAEATISDFRRSRPPDRRAFAAHLLLKSRT
jgi:uncharacterized protein (UPF0332 family)